MPLTITPEERARLRELVAKTSTGPWEADCDSPECIVEPTTVPVGGARQCE